MDSIAHFWSCTIHVLCPDPSAAPLVSRMFLLLVSSGFIAFLSWLIVDFLRCNVHLGTIAIIAPISIHNTAGDAKYRRENFAVPLWIIIFLDYVRLSLNTQDRAFG